MFYLHVFVQVDFPIHNDTIKMGWLITVNLEIFARVLFLRNFAYAKFREKFSPQGNRKIIPSFPDIVKAYPGFEFLMTQIYSQK